MDAKPKIKHVMTAIPQTISVGQSVHDAQVMMEEFDLRHLPVVAESEVVGILSERDIALAMTVKMKGENPKAIQVEDICIFDKFIADPEDPLDHVLEQMAKRHIGSAIVMQSDQLLGIFTSTDACRFWAEHLRGNDLNRW